MVIGLTTRIEIDATGVAWIAGTNTKVKEVVLDKLAYGWSAEEMHFQHPHLSMAQIHAALAYYYENRTRIDADIQEGERLVAALKAQAPPSLLQEKLRHRNADGANNPVPPG